MLAFLALRGLVKTLRRMDAATVAAYFGSDSAGTFVSCVGVLNAGNISYAAFMPVMLAVMEIPGCLVGLFLVSRLRNEGMDALGNMADEPNYDPHALPRHQMDIAHDPKHDPHAIAVKDEKRMALEAKEDDNGIGNGNGHNPGGLFSHHLLPSVFFNPQLL